MDLRPASIAMVLFLLAGLLPAAAQDTPGSAETELLNQQKKIQRLRKGIEDQKSRVKDVREKEVDLLSELEKIDLRLEADRSQLAEFQKTLASQEQKIKEKQAEVEEARLEKEAASVHLKKRLNAYYRMDPAGVMNVLFSATSLPELLSFQEYFQQMLEHDQEMIRGYRENIEGLLEATAAYETEKRELVDVISSVKAQEEKLSGTRQEKSALLARVKAEKKLYQLALAELEEASDHLTATLKKLKQEAGKADKAKASRAAPAPKKRKGAGFAAMKGKLSPPVRGSVTQKFGKNPQGKFGITTFAKGIDIKADAGTEIRAIFDGKVVYAGVLRGYGNLLIIDHGDQYYSLLATAEKFLKNEGDQVSENEVVGVMTDQEGLLAEGLHFEIRHGTEPENPLHWVNNAELKIKSRKEAEAK